MLKPSSKRCGLTVKASTGFDQTVAQIAESALREWKERPHFLGMLAARTCVPYGPRGGGESTPSLELPYSVQHGKRCSHRLIEVASTIHTIKQRLSLFN